MFLLDTNCFIQIVRNRPEAPSVQKLLQSVPISHLFMTDYTCHSIGVMMSRFGQVQGYVSFLQGIGVGGGLGIASIDTGQLQQVVNACITHQLDFDDAYQYVAAEMNDLILVSLDADFDRTPRGRLTPDAAIKKFKDEHPEQPKASQT